MKLLIFSYDKWKWVYFYIIFWMSKNTFSAVNHKVKSNSIQSQFFHLIFPCSGKIPLAAKGIDSIRLHKLGLQLFFHTLAKHGKPG